MLDELLTAHEYMAVVGTLEEEIYACEEIGQEDGEEPERAEILRTALAKLVPERSGGSVMPKDALQIVIELKDDDTTTADWMAAGDTLRALFRKQSPGRICYRLVNYEEARDRPIIEETVRDGE